MAERGFARGSSEMFRPRSPHQLLLSSGFMHILLYRKINCTTLVLHHILSLFFIRF